MRNEPFKISFLEAVTGCHLMDTLSSSYSSDGAETAAILCQLSDLNTKVKQLQAITMLPPKIQAKVDALKKIQLDVLHKEAEFHKQVHSMETVFQGSISQMYEKRRKIVEGSYNVSTEDLLNREELDAGSDEQVKGIPEFWLSVFQMAPVLQSMIRDKDEKALKHLVDVRSVMIDQPKTGFILEFEFEPNDYFTNRVLTKKYLMECVPNPEKPSLFNGFEIYDTTGCDIDWKDGANLTVEDEAGQEHLASSFFNFFNPQKLFAKADPVMFKQFMESDFEIGYFIKERVVPRAILFYSGDFVDIEAECSSDDFAEKAWGENN